MKDPISIEQCIQFAQESLFVGLVISAPFIIACVLLGLGISLIQSLTQLQEQALGFFAKYLAVFAILTFFGFPLSALLVKLSLQIFHHLGAS